MAPIETHFARMKASGEWKSRKWAELFRWAFSEWPGCRGLEGSVWWQVSARWTHFLASINHVFFRFLNANWCFIFLGFVHDIHYLYMPFQNDGLVLNLHPLVHQWNSLPAVAVLCSVTSPSTGRQSCHQWVGRVVFQWFLESSSRVSCPGAIKLQDKFMEHLGASPAFPATTLPKMYQPHVWHYHMGSLQSKWHTQTNSSMHQGQVRKNCKGQKGKNIHTTSSNDI